MSAVEPDGYLPEDNGGAANGHPLRRWGRLAGIAGALVMSLLFAAAAWYALQRSDMQSSVTAEIPLIKADQRPVKEKPEDPGGLKIPNQDKLVFERITPKAQAPIAEKMAPAPEEPIVKVVAPAAPALTGTVKPTPETSAAMAAQTAAKAMTDKAAAPEVASPAAVQKHAAPPAIFSQADTAKASKVESILPPAEPVKAPAGQAATAAPSTPTTNAAPKAAPQAVAKPPVASPPVALRKAPEVKAPVAQTAAKAAEVETEKSGYRIQLAAFRKPDLADLAWNRLMKAHGDLLGGLTGHMARVDLGKRGTFYRVQAGTFLNEAAARATCGKLKAKKQDCIIVPPR